MTEEELMDAIDSLPEEVLNEVEALRDSAWLDALSAYLENADSYDTPEQAIGALVEETKRKVKQEFTRFVGQRVI